LQQVETKRCVLKTISGSGPQLIADPPPSETVAHGFRRQSRMGRGLRRASEKRMSLLVEACDEEIETIPVKKGREMKRFEQSDIGLLDEILG